MYGHALTDVQTFGQYMWRRL